MTENREPKDSFIFVAAEHQVRHLHIVLNKYLNGIPEFLEVSLRAISSLKVSFVYTFIFKTTDMSCE